jgi:hypothetical protein
MIDKKRSIVEYRQCVTGILPIHELHFHGDISCRALAIGEIKTLRIHVQQVPEGEAWKENDMKKKQYQLIHI